MLIDEGGAREKYLMDEGQCTASLLLAPLALLPVLRAPRGGANLGLSGRSSLSARCARSAAGASPLPRLCERAPLSSSPCGDGPALCSGGVSKPQIHSRLLIMPMTPLKLYFGAGVDFSATADDAKSFLGPCTPSLRRCFGFGPGFCS